MSDTDLATSIQAEEILKEFLELASHLPNELVSAADQKPTTKTSSSSKHIDEKYVLANIKLVLDNCVRRGGSAKSEMSIKILDILVRNYSNLDYATKMSEHIASMLDKVCN